MECLTIPVCDQLVVALELAVACVVGALERAWILRAILGVRAVVQRQERKSSLARGVRRSLEVERIRLAITRPRRVRAASIVRCEQCTGSAPLRQDHQTPAARELDEALRLAGHIHGFGRQPLDQLVVRSAGGLRQALQVARGQRHA